MSKIEVLKKEFVEYYKDVPVQKYAAMFIGRDEDTVIRWKGKDQEFADAVRRAKADWVRKKVIATKAEFALEKLAKELFNEASESDYDRAIRTTNINPNAPKAKQVANEVLEIMMKKYAMPPTDEEDDLDL